MNPVPAFLSDILSEHGISLFVIMWSTSSVSIFQGRDVNVQTAISIGVGCFRIRAENRLFGRQYVACRWSVTLCWEGLIKQFGDDWKSVHRQTGVRTYCPVFALPPEIRCKCCVSTNGHTCNDTHWIIQHACLTHVYLDLCSFIHEHICMYGMGEATGSFR